MFKAAGQKLRLINSFTLLELICVLAISTLVIGVVVGRIGKAPSFISLKSCAFKVQSVLSEASNLAVVNGKQIVIQYSDRKFFPVNNETGSISSSKYLTYTLPESIDIEFPNNEEEEVSFTFYPDSSASAPEIKLFSKKQLIIIKTSKLTGVTTLSYE